MMELYDVREPGMLRKGQFLDSHHPGAILSHFNAPSDQSADHAKAAYAALETLKQLHKSHPAHFAANARRAPPRISLRRTPLEGLCPPRQPPACPPASHRYRTLDGTCNNARKARWGSAHSPFHRFLAPAYADGVELVRRSVVGDAPLASARFVSLLVHGTRDEDAAVTLMLAQWGQFVDHDVTSTAQPRSINGSVPSCCDAGPDDFQHPSCLPIKVPSDDPWLAPLQIRCLEFLRSAPALRADCALTWREQTNQVTSHLDASTIYSSSQRTSESVRSFRDGRLHFGRGNPAQDVCQRNALANQCIRTGDGRSGEQPGLLAMHLVWVGEHNRVAAELARMNGHWSDEKLFQEARRIVGAMVQHITYREFVPLVVGREVCRLFDLELLPVDYYEAYDVKVNPTVANAFSAAAFRFGHSLIQGSYMRCAANHQFISNNVSLHNENADGDIGSAGSLHRLLRGLAVQRSQKRDEFITAELTNHLFQSGGFPFGLDLAAINIQRGRDHGLPAYTQWREPCGLSPIRDWADLERVVGAESARRMEQGYRSVDDVDLFVAGLSERPVIGGLVGPTFACIIAQQFSNMRKGDRFWYENGGFESSFTPAQLQAVRQVSLAQVLCRTFGVGSTLQPHVFLPHDGPGNERRPCGVGVLAPIDLSPWQERDPSFVKKEDVFRDPPVGAFHNKQESFDLPEFGNSFRPNRGKPPTLSRPQSSFSQSGPLPGSFIVELEPESLTKPQAVSNVRPNREPLLPPHPSSSHRPHEPSALSRPSHSTTPTPLQSPTSTASRPNREPSTALPAFVHQEHSSSSTHEISSTSSIVDKVDFISNGATGVHFHQNVALISHDAPQTERPIDNKLDFTDKKALTLIKRPDKRPVFQLTTHLRTADRIHTTANASTATNATSGDHDADFTNSITGGEHTISKRDIRAFNTTDLDLKLDQTLTNQTANIRATPKFGFNANSRPQTNQQIQYPTARPTRIKTPNVVIIQGTSTHELDSDEYSDTLQDPDRYGLYRPPYETITTRPPHNQIEYPSPVDQYAISYDVTVTTTEKYSIYKPIGQREPFYPPRDGTFEEYNQSPQQASYNFRPDKVHLGPTRQPTKPPSQFGISTPFSWDAKSVGNDDAEQRNDRRWPDAAAQHPTKLDFDSDATYFEPSPFSGGMSAAPNRRPATVYVMHDDYDNSGNDDIDIDNRPTTRRQSDKLQSMVTWRPSAVHVMHEALTSTERVATTTARYPPYSPANVLTNIYSSITRFFGVGKNTGLRLGHEMDPQNETSNDLGLAQRIDGDSFYNWTTDYANNGTDELPGQNSAVHFLTDAELAASRNATVAKLSAAQQELVDADYTNSTLQYDLDGYLRPEHMHHNLGQTTTTTTADNLTDNRQPTDDRTETLRPLHWHELESRARSPNIISIVPFEVLTRPERPDNWVFVDAVHPVDALPASPPLANSENSVREMPRPFHSAVVG